MELLEKYSALIDMAKQYNLAIESNNKVMKISVELQSGDVKDRIWDIYKQLDPHFKSNDLVLNVEVKSREGSKVKVVTQSSHLNIRQAPGTEQYLVGKAEKGEVLTLLNKVDKQWWHIRTEEGVEGYCYAQYLEAID